MAGTDKDVRALVREVEGAGWTVAQEGTKLRITGPNGEGPVFIPGRAIGHGLANYRAELRRAGCPLPSSSGRAAPAADDTVTPPPSDSFDPVAAVNGLCAWVADQVGREDATEWRGIAESLEADLERERERVQAADLGLPRGRAGKAEHQVHLTPTRKAEEPLLSVSSGRVTAEVEYRVVGKPDDEHPELLEVPEFDKLLAPDDEAPLAVTHVNPRYLLRVAQVQHPPMLGGPPVSVEMRGYRKPVIFRWPNHTEAVAIVMPVRTQVDE